MPLLWQEIPPTGLPEETPRCARAISAGVSLLHIQPGARGRQRPQSGVPVPPVWRALPVGGNQGQTPSVARHEGRAAGGSVGRGTPCRCVPHTWRTGRAADLHVQALSVHVLQFSRARETRQQVSPLREPSGDAAADGRETVTPPEAQSVGVSRFPRFSVNVNLCLDTQISSSQYVHVGKS